MIMNIKNAKIIYFIKLKTLKRHSDMSLMYFDKRSYLAETQKLAPSDAELAALQILCFEKITKEVNAPIKVDSHEVYPVGGISKVNQTICPTIRNISLSNMNPTHICITVEHQSRGVRRGGGGEDSPPPEIGKIVVEIWCYLPEVYTFGAESEIQEIFSKNCEKVNFPYRF